jgi:hypothetical protein
MGISRVVTHPDWQGLGLAFLLIDNVAAAYKAIGRRVNNYPAHPSFIRAHDRSPNWALVARPGFALTQRGGTDRGRRIKMAYADAQSAHDRPNQWDGERWTAGSRPCATFSYIGPALDHAAAVKLMAPYLK